MGIRFVLVKGKSKFTAASRFFGEKDLGKPIRPFSVKKTKVKGLFNVGIKF